MSSWESFTLAEQTLLRRAMSDSWLAGTVQAHGVNLRWTGADGAPPPRSYTEHEQRALVPLLSAVATDLADRGLLTIHESARAVSSDSEAGVGGSRLSAILATADNWIWSRRRPSEIQLSAPRTVHERWFDDAYPKADNSGLPRWDELSLDQRRVLVCAAEASGMLTGPFGVLDGPPAELDATRRLDWIDRQLAPLAPFARDRLIEVRRYPDPTSDEFTLIEVDRLRDTLADPALWSDDLDWGVGVGCVFTYAGLAAWRGAWSSAWNARLTFE
ncbi:hypothetical protein GA0070624_2122 [Micromonospora rhizosphaerae]|uniref:Uncharacterized protein n=1 Tax=Micromonospora rhizosphaerae TaxID=568872 RepID=A0A1C6RUS3_9ACTN|nr:hypothetical protein [Micromonospora rhizosphaerae]SCL20809.1 hypothetical protein GA0070624_2122 [Micromonospora rhizosphaerae]